MRLALNPRGYTPADSGQRFAAWITCHSTDAPE
jgi:hypothetical protein